VTQRRPVAMECAGFAGALESSRLLPITGLNARPHLAFRTILRAGRLARRAKVPASRAVSDPENSRECAGIASAFFADSPSNRLAAHTPIGARHRPPASAKQRREHQRNTLSSFGRYHARRDSSLNHQRSAYLLSKERCPLARRRSNCLYMIVGQFDHGALRQQAIVWPSAVFTIIRINGIGNLRVTSQLSFRFSETRL